MTLYILDIDKKTGRFFKTAFVYLIISIICALFGAIYEIYSHEVYSYYMIYAFAFPLIGGSFVFSLMGLIRIKSYPCAFSRNLYHCGIATLTVGSIVRGVLEIYGTTNSLVKYYWLVGISLLIAGGLTYLFQFLRNRLIYNKGGKSGE